MLDISDLIGVPYKEHGRDKNGLDCYGLAIECWRRLGHNLPDVIYEDHDTRLSEENAPLLPIKKTDKIQEGTLIEMTFYKELHIGVCLDSKTFVHATRNQGVRISKIGVIPIRSFYLWD